MALSWWPPSWSPARRSSAAAVVGGGLVGGGLVGGGLVGGGLVWGGLVCGGLVVTGMSGASPTLIVTTSPSSSRAGVPRVLIHHVADPLRPVVLDVHDLDLESDVGELLAGARLAVADEVRDLDPSLGGGRRVVAGDDQGDPVLHADLVAGGRIGADHPAGGDVAALLGGDVDDAEAGGVERLAGLVDRHPGHVRDDRRVVGRVDEQLHAFALGHHRTGAGIGAVDDAVLELVVLLLDDLVREIAPTEVGDDRVERLADVVRAAHGSTAARRWPAC